jgi:hypothetical protein
VATPSSSKGDEAKPPRMCGRSLMLHKIGKQLPAQAVEQEGRLAVERAAGNACTKLPIRPVASGASKITGHLRVFSLRAPSRDRARRAA